MGLLDPVHAPVEGHDAGLAHGRKHHWEVMTWTSSPADEVTPEGGMKPSLD
jgi:hypothetical protein